MRITVIVALDSDDNFAYTPDAGATQVLAALGGNPTTDYCMLSVQQAATGTAGSTPPETPPS
jgi:hypothetical protein